MKLCVHIPVFNAAKQLQALADTICESYPKQIRGLRFLVTDDASTDPQIHALYKSHRFFRRRDVVLQRLTRNIGYTKSVNLAFRQLKGAEDIVLLNSDTQISPQVFERLHHAANRLANVASVTPLSNNAHIASLFNFPYGGAFPSGASVADVNLRLSDYSIEESTDIIPNSIGYCVLIPHKSLKRVGPLNEQEFPIGYGEESDWSMRARELGLQSYLLKSLFVRHDLGQSFRGQRRRLVAAALAKLESLHPGYSRLISNYVNEAHFDPWRIRVSSILLRSRRKRLGVSLRAFVVKDDPWVSWGAAEQMVRGRTQEALLSGADVLVAFAMTEGVGLRYFTGQDQVFQWALKIEDKVALLALREFLESASEIEVHSLLGVSSGLIKLIARCRSPMRRVVLHDFSALCPTGNLIGSGGVYCQSPTRITQCRKCLQINHGVPDFDMREYRNGTTSLIGEFDEVLSSSTIGQVLHQRTLKINHNKSIRSRIKVSNPPHIGVTKQPQAALAFSNKVIFLERALAGGGRLIAEAASLELINRGLQVEIWRHEGQNEFYQGIHFVPYQDDTGLLRLAPQARGAIICLPYVWPEPSQLSIQEAIRVMGCPVVVGPYGFPAKYVNESGIGVVMRRPDVKSLLHSLERLIKNFRPYARAVAKLNESATL